MSRLQNKLTLAFCFPLNQLPSDGWPSAFLLTPKPFFCRVKILLHNACHPSNKARLSHALGYCATLQSTCAHLPINIFPLREFCCLTSGPHTCCHLTTCKRLSLTSYPRQSCQRTSIHRVNLLARTLLRVVLPHAWENRTVLMKISVLSVCLVIHPLSFIDVSVCVEEPTLSTRFVFVPVTLIARTIRPHLNAVSFL